MSLASSAARGAILLSASTIINILVGFLGGILLARLLDPNDFGTFALAITLSTLIDIRGKLQLEQKYIRDRDERPEYLDTFYTLSAGFAGISFCLLLVAALGVMWLNRLDLALCLIVVGIVNLIEPLSAAIRLSIEKQVAFRQVAIIQSLAGLIQFSVTLVAAIAGLGLLSLLLGIIAATLVNLISFLRIAPHRPALRLDRQLAREFVAYGLKYGVVFTTSVSLLNNFDNFIIGLIGGTFALGFYDRAYRTALWPALLVSTSLGRISLPTYAKLQDDPARLSKAFSIILWTVLTLTPPIALTLLVTAADLVPTLYGEKWLPAVPILQLLAAFAAFRPLSDDLCSILVATHRPGQMARLTFIQAVVLVILSVPLTWFYGAAGTAVSIGVAFMISAIFLLYFGHKHLQVNVMEIAGLPLLNNLVALVGYMIIRLFLPLDGLSSFLKLGTEAALMLGIYGLVSVLTSGTTMVRRLQYIIQMVRS